MTCFRPSGNLASEPAQKCHPSRVPRGHETACRGPAARIAVEPKLDSKIRGLDGCPGRLHNLG